MPSFTKLTTFAALATLVAVKAQPPPCIRTYEIKSGDYCDKISAEQGVSSYQLITVNIGSINAACSNLWVGQIICLAREGIDCSPVVVVESGNDCTTLATEAGITFADILANNPNINPECSNIYPGQVLCVQPPPPARK